MSLDSTTSEPEEIDENFYVGSGSFQLPNGDRYDGEYMAHRHGLVWREGDGVYTTIDGQKYSGRWYNDKLVDGKQLQISYSDGSSYEGMLVDNKYFGPGRYANENLQLSCEFSDNKPVGDVVMLDDTGKLWQGVAQENECFLLPEHIFFNNISEDAGKGNVREKISTGTVTSVAIQTPPNKKSVNIDVDDRKFVVESRKVSQSFTKTLESKIFAKTKKTISDLRFEDSEWYKKYLDFKEHFEHITNKVDTEGIGALNDEEKLWYENYLKFKNRYLEIPKGKKADKDLAEYNLLRLFNSDEYKNSCPAISVIYPSNQLDKGRKHRNASKERRYSNASNEKRYSTASQERKNSIATKEKRTSDASMKG